MVIMTRDYVLTNVFLKIQSLGGWIELIGCVFNNAPWDILLIILQSHVSKSVIQVHMLIIQREDVCSAVQLIHLLLQLKMT